MGWISDVWEDIKDEVLDPIEETVTSVVDPLLPESVKEDPWQAAISIGAAPFTGGTSLWGLVPYGAESAGWLPEGMGADLSTALLTIGALSGAGGWTLPGFGEGGMFGPTAGGGDLSKLSMEELLSWTPEAAGGGGGIGGLPDLFSGGDIWSLAAGGDVSGLGNILSFLPGFGEGFGGDIVGGGISNLFGGGQAGQVGGLNLANLFGGQAQAGSIWDTLLKGALGIGSAGLEAYLSGEELEKQREFYEELYAPQKAYQEKQLKLFEDIFEPTSRQIGGLLQAQLTEPFQLPEDLWAKTWQKARERTMAEFAPVERRTTQRLAGIGGLDVHGQAQKLFGDIETQKVKSIESLAVEQAISEWTEKKQAKQQSFENVFKYLGYEPSVSTPTTYPYQMQDYSGISDLGSRISELIYPKPATQFAF